MKKKYKKIKEYKEVEEHVFFIIISTSYSFFPQVVHADELEIWMLISLCSNICHRNLQSAHVSHLMLENLCETWRNF